MRNLYSIGFIVLFVLAGFHHGNSQATNMHFSSLDLTRVFQGLYAPGEFPMNPEYGSPEDLVSYVDSEISADSMKAYLIAMQQFHNRNSGSDTLSATKGIGAARNWMRDQFQRFSIQSGGSMITGFFEFDQDICGMGHHKNVVAMLPGTEPFAGVIIIEAHLDSRCAEVCDTACLAQGMEDNGSGIALVLELARVLSRYNYKHTLVFVGTTAEEQGLDGARSMAIYATEQGAKITLVQNNDVVGGIVCGETSSPPSCPGEGHIDSTQVRLFSNGGFNSPHKAVCRYVKLQYDEMLRDKVKVPMKVTIMTAEDRTGRGGDHIPYREQGFPAMRFTSANEHGDAGIDPDYHDRQHTSGDILGVDNDQNGTLDSFFVDFNYLARNAVINGTSAVMAAIAPPAPVITDFFFDGMNFFVKVEGDQDYPEYRIGLRTDFHDYDSLYSLAGTDQGSFGIPNQEFFVFLSAMAVDSNGVESLPSEEVRALFSGTEEVEEEEKKIYLNQNVPNPFDESTILSYWVNEQFPSQQAEIIVTGMNGQVIARLPTVPVQGMNEVVYYHGYKASGQFNYALVIDGKLIDQKMMVFAN